MNKAKRQDKTLIMLCIGVVFMLIVTAVMSFAYFTAKAESKSQQIQFGVLELDPINDFSLTSKESHTPIVPGCTINMAGTIKLTTESNVDAFVRLKPTVKVTKDGETGTEEQKTKFVTLFNSALSAGTGSSWLKRNDKTDDYLYFVGKFSNDANGETNARIVKIFNFAGSSFTIDPTIFGNEWQGVTVSIGLTVQAIQASHVGVDDVNDNKYNNNAGSNNGDQALVNDIAKAEAWNSEEFKPATMDKLAFTININTASVKAKEKTIAGEVVIPAYIKAKTGGGYDEAISGETGAIPVTSIGSYAFDGCSGLTSITIPNNVTSIGDNAFFGFGSLTTVIIDSSKIAKNLSGVYSCGCLMLYAITIKIKDGICEDSEVGQYVRENYSKSDNVDEKGYWVYTKK